MWDSGCNRHQNSQGIDHQKHLKFLANHCEWLALHDLLVEARWSKSHLHERNSFYLKIGSQGLTFANRWEQACLDQLWLYQCSLRYIRLLVRRGLWFLYKSPVIGEDYVTLSMVPYVTDVQTFDSVIERFGGWNSAYKQIDRRLQ